MHQSVGKIWILKTKYFQAISKRNLILMLTNMSWNHQLVAKGIQNMHQQIEARAGSRAFLGYINERISILHAMSKN